MIDNKLLLNDFERVKELLLQKKVELDLIENARRVVNEYKAILIQLENLKAAQNAHSKKFAEAKKTNVDVESLKFELSALKENIIILQAKLDAKENEMNEFLRSIPNLPDSKTPIGASEVDNVEIERVLSPREFDFNPKAHWELGQQNNWIDFEAGVKLAKSRFSVLKNEAAKLNRALINFMLESNAEFGFSEVCTPAIVNKECLFGTGQLPKFEDDMFKIDSFIDTSTELKKGEKPKGHELYLISTAEITLTNLYANSIIAESELPIKLCAHTPCFRKEAGSAGKDTRGIIRQHQFDKVELVALCAAEKSDEMQELMLECASSILKKLGLAHRFVQLCSGDLGFSARNTVDIEVWLPAQHCYREISSVSNCGDFQARRAKIRYKSDGKNKLVHTLNGSSLAVGRTLVAIMENYQNSDGSIEIPPVLRKYLG